MIIPIDPANPSEPGTWRVVLRCAWRDDELPEPFGATARPMALSHGVRLVLNPQDYVAYFAVSAVDMSGASRMAMAKWCALAEKVALPNWPIVELTIGEVRPPVGAEFEILPEVIPTRNAVDGPTIDPSLAEAGF